MSRRTTNERRLVPPLLRKRPRRVKSVSRPGGVATELVHLTNVFRDRFEKVRVRNRPQRRRRPASHTLVVAIRNRHKHAGVVVRRRPKDQPVFADAQSPGVVIAGANELQIGHFRRITLREFEPPEPLAKRLG